MAASAGAFAQDNSTDANFQSWGKAISDAFLAGGWTRTADTGQVTDWTTQTRPTGTQQARCFEIFQMTDALAATKPVFAKIEYGSGTSINNPQIWYTFGTTTNGSGTLGGVTTTRRNHTWASAGAAVTHTCAFSASTSRFTMALWLSNSTNALFLNIERTCDTAGDDTGDGYVWHTALTSTTRAAEYVLTDGSLNWGVETVWHALHPQSGSSMTYNGDTGLAAIHPYRFGAQPAIRGAVLTMSADYARDTILADVDHYGVARDFYVLSTPFTTLTGSNSATRIAMLYE